jgi:hypothetical protein
LEPKIQLFLVATLLDLSLYTATDIPCTFEVMRILTYGITMPFNFIISIMALPVQSAFVLFSFSCHGNNKGMFCFNLDFNLCGFEGINAYFDCMWIRGKANLFELN